MGKLIDLTGVRFGKLTVVKQGKSIANRGATWDCVCDCGGIATVRTDLLKCGNNKSCGCLLREWVKSGTCNKKHGKYNAKEYRTWTSMKARCENPNHKYYSYYGGRGITVCEEWKKSFGSFISDMGERPDGGTLERINNSLGYFPKNCKWATRAEQSRNKRNNIFVEKDGERLCIKDWANRLGWSDTTLNKWLKKGMPINKFFVKKHINT